MLAEKLADAEVAVKTQICFGACWMGPNVVLHPEGTWYSNVQPGDVDEIEKQIWKTLSSRFSVLAKTSNP
jgi:(2Fe-2S) ferredoxin